MSEKGGVIDDALQWCCSSEGMLCHFSAHIENFTPGFSSISIMDIRNKHHYFVMLDNGCA